MGDVRRIALRLLEGWERDDTYLNLALNSPATASLSSSERGFLTALLYGTVERRITLDYLISRIAARSDLAPGTRNILRLGFYQLFFMKNVPAHAAADMARSLIGDGMSLSEAAKQAAKAAGLKKGDVYRMLVSEAKESE